MFSRVSLMAALALVVAGGCSGSDDPKPPPEDQPTCAEKAPAAFASASAITKFDVSSDASNVSVTWEYTGTATVASWRLMYGADQASMTTQSDPVEGSVRYLRISNLEQERVYHVYLVGLDAEGCALKDGEKLIATMPKAVRTDVPTFGDAASVAAGNGFRSPAAVYFANGSATVFVEKDLRVVVYARAMGETSWKQVGGVDAIASNISVAANPANGQLVACYKSENGRQAWAYSSEYGANLIDQTLFMPIDPGEGIPPPPQTRELTHCSVAFNPHDGSFLMATDSSVLPNEDPEATPIPQIRLRRSTDGGATWSEPITVVETPTENIGTVMLAVDPVVRKNEITGQADWTNVYLAYQMQGAEVTNIHFAVSRDGGSNWTNKTTAQRMNPITGAVAEDTGKPMQLRSSGQGRVYPFIAVAPSNGRVVVAFEYVMAAPLVAIAQSDNFMRNSPYGEWSLKEAFGISSAYSISNARLLCEGDQTLVTFSSNHDSGFRPYLTRFDSSAPMSYEPSNPPIFFFSPFGAGGGYVEVSDRPIAALANAFQPVYANGPLIIGDGGMTRVVVWLSGNLADQGELLFSSVP